jgi:molybdenum cofactor cytidylyltransferase
VNSKHKRVAGVILAAGEGRRAGRNKGLLEIGGVTFIEKVAIPLREAGCEPVLVVGGADADAVQEESERLGLSFVVNENWRRGQFSSLKTGLSHLATGAAGAFVALVDHPFVADETYRALLIKFSASPGSIVVPSHGGRRGHPVLIPEQVIEEILLSPDDSTLRDIMRKHRNLIIQQEVTDSGILKDIDTLAELERSRQKGDSAMTAGGGPRTTADEK